MTTCKHCGEHFEGGVEIIGQPGARLQSLLHKLGSHMNTKHPEHAQAMGVIGADFMGWLFLANFKSADEQLNLYCDQRRWHIHQQTLNARFSDESLKKQCSQLATVILGRFPRSWQGEDTELIHVTAILLEVFTGMRNDLEEPNRYSAAPSLVS